MTGDACFPGCDWRLAEIHDRDGEKYLVVECRDCDRIEDAGMELLGLMEIRNATAQRVRELEEVINAVKHDIERLRAIPNADRRMWHRSVKRLGQAILKMQRRLDEIPVPRKDEEE